MRGRQRLCVNADKLDEKNIEDRGSPSPSTSSRTSPVRREDSGLPEEGHHHKSFNIHFREGFVKDRAQDLIDSLSL